MTEQALLLARPYGRDYAWLPGALQLYTASVHTGDGVGLVSFIPQPGQGIRGDLGWQYGLAPGQTLHFLLEDPADPAPLAAWAPLLPADAPGQWYGIPVKTGRPALGWQLGLYLGAVRPLAMLRPFYLFTAAEHLAAQGPLRRVPQADTRRLGKLLDTGWAGVGHCPTAGEILLQKRVQAGPCI